MEILEEASGCKVIVIQPDYGLEEAELPNTLTDNLGLVFKLLAKKVGKDYQGLISKFVALHIQINENGEEVVLLEDVIRFYEEFRKIREFLRHLAADITYYARYKSRHPSLDLNNQKIYFPVRFIFSNNHLVIEEDLILQHLQLIEIERLRTCPICNYLFWAKRLDMWSCSTKCNQILRTRRHRAKQQSRFPSRVKKEGENKNGTL
jgi:predicted nucleic acid-binding Zn ribbon protein